MNETMKTRMVLERAFGRAVIDPDKHVAVNLDDLPLVLKLSDSDATVFAPSITEIDFRVVLGGRPGLACTLENIGDQDIELEFGSEDGTDWTTVYTLKPDKTLEPWWNVYRVRVTLKTASAAMQVIAL